MSGTQPGKYMKDTVDVTVRTRPKYSTFILLGVLCGFIVAGILTVLPVDTSQLAGEYSKTTVLGLLMAFLGIVGGFLGAILALIVERVAAKRARVYTVKAEYEAVEPEPAPTSAAGETAGTEQAADETAGTEKVPSPDHLGNETPAHQRVERKDPQPRSVEE